MPPFAGLTPLDNAGDSTDKFVLVISVADGAPKDERPHPYEERPPGTSRLNAV